MSRRYNFGELVGLTNQMQAKLPGARLEAGYAISGPDEAGYFEVVGPDLPNPAFISGSASFFHPETGKLIFQPYIPPPKPRPETIKFPLVGWIIVGAIIFILLK